MISINGNMMPNEDCPDLTHVIRVEVVSTTRQEDIFLCRNNQTKHDDIMKAVSQKFMLPTLINVIVFAPLVWSFPQPQVHPPPPPIPGIFSPCGQRSNSTSNSTSPTGCKDGLTCIIRKPKSQFTYRTDSGYCLSSKIRCGGLPGKRCPFALECIVSREEKVGETGWCADDLLNWGIQSNGTRKRSIRRGRRLGSDLRI
jgi:hypothetical protein